LLATFLSLAGIALYAGDPDSGSTYVVVGIIEGPDPIPQAWDDDGPTELNASTTVPVDRGPDVGFLPGTNYPVMVWADDRGSDRDIAFNEWDGNNWLATPVYLTAGLGDELDPRIHVQANGTLHVVWWDSTDRVYLATRPAGSAVWSVPTPILEPARRPSIAVGGGRMLVAYERDSAAGAGQDVVVAMQRLDGAWRVDAVATTPHTSRLDVRLHSDASRLWLRWTHADHLVAFSEYRDGQWVAPDDFPWFDRDGVASSSISNARSGLQGR
jgi:hypothetical protein